MVTRVKFSDCSLLYKIPAKSIYSKTIKQQRIMIYASIFDF